MSEKIKIVKDLHNKTNLSLNICLKTLYDTNWDVDKAFSILKSPIKLKNKETKEGVIDCYFNNNGSVIGIVEVNCETKNTAERPIFKDFVEETKKALLNGGLSKIEKKRKDLMFSLRENIVIKKYETWRKLEEPVCRGIYLNSSKKIGSMIEIYCYDHKFAKEEKIIQFANDCAMQIAVSNPNCISVNFNSKSKDNKALLSLPFIKQKDKTVGKIMSEIAGSYNIWLIMNKFVRYELGRDF